MAPWHKWLKNDILTTFTTFTTYPHYAILWLCSLRCFTSLLTPTMVLSSSKFFSPGVSVFHKICMCHSNFTVRNFSGVLHTLLPSVPGINRIFYFFKRSEGFESANITNLVLSIRLCLKRPQSLKTVGRTIFF